MESERQHAQANKTKKHDTIQMSEKDILISHNNHIYLCAVGMS